MSHQALLAAAYASESEYLRKLEELVRFESPTDDKAACDALADHLAKSLADSGWLVERHSRERHGDILEASMEGAGGPRTLLLAHLDTVWPLGMLSEMPLRREDDKLYGPGTLDMKAGIVTALMAVDLVAIPHSIQEQYGLAFCGTPAELPRLLAESDYLSVHVPLTKSTRHMLDGAALSAMKHSAVMINVARGEIIDEAALAEALTRSSEDASSPLVAFRSGCLGDQPTL